MMVTARFFGGEADGRVFPIDENLLEGYRVPVPVDIVLEMASPSNLAYVWHEPEIHTYRWDITINEAGEYRMRWRP